MAKKIIAHVVHDSTAVGDEVVALCGARMDVKVLNDPTYRACGYCVMALIAEHQKAMADLDAMEETHQTFRDTVLETLLRREERRQQLLDDAAAEAAAAIGSKPKKKKKPKKEKEEDLVDPSTITEPTYGTAKAPPFDA